MSSSQFFENFTLCDLDNFNVILKNTFLDAYKVNILHNKSKVRICAKVGSKLMNLDAKNNFTLVGVGISLVALVNELKLPSFDVLMFLRISQGELKPQRATQPLACILDSFNKFSKVLTYELPDVLPTCGEGDHKIKMLHGLNLPYKAPYSLNQKKTKRVFFFKNNLFS